jgi:NAD-dependent deacetylase
MDRVLWRRRQVAQAQPNSAHLCIPRLANAGWDVSVVTQNIDDLHERAGSAQVIHLHGSLMSVKCFACHRPSVLTLEQMGKPDGDQLTQPPRCGRCNGKLRPDIVWFKENLPQAVWRLAVQAVRDCDLLISVGTSGVIMPAASLPQMALAAKAKVVHVNIEDVRIGGSDEIMLIGNAESLLPALLQSLGNDISPVYT